MRSIGKGKVSFSGLTLGLVCMAGLLCGVSASSAEASLITTVATFSDPAANGSTPLFTLTGSASAVGSTLTGGWSGTGLDLIIPWTNTTYEDATFTMDSLTVTAPYVLSGGQIIFYDNLNNPILQIDFDSAMLYAPFGFGASTLESHNVSFSGTAVSFPVLGEESFAFSFANQVIVSSSPSVRTYTAAFTSSALIPEPTSLALIVFGTLAVTFVRMRKR